ncbi:MAG: GtrA family protein [Rudaea sp.]
MTLSIAALAKPLRDRQVVRFVLVGVLNTAFSYLVYAALLYIGLNFALANFGACALGILFSFRTQGVLVFKNPAPRLLLRYAAFWLCVYACNIGLIKLFLLLGLNAYAAGALALPPIVAMSFILQKYFVFRQAAPVPSSRE